MSILPDWWPAASKGEGLGNQFLSHIRETHAIAHVVRCFEDENIVHVDGKINPLSDIDTINTELALADLESVQRSLERLNKKARSGDKEAKAQIEFLDTLESWLGDGNPVHAMDLNDDQQQILKNFHLITAKPMFYIANIAEGGDSNNPLLDQLMQLADAEEATVVPVCAAIEAEIASLDEEDKQEFLDDLGLDEPGLNRIIQAGYALLDLQTYFTAGEKEVRAWTVNIGATAPQAAGVIHTDFERGFIRAELVGYDDYINSNGEHGAKEAGKWRLEGKDYIVKDGDVIHFRFNV